MTHEVKVKTLEGGVVTVEVIPTKTIRELMVMLREKKDCEDPIERQICKLKILVDGSVPDDDQTLESLGLLNAESEVTVIYYRNEVVAGKKEAIHEEGLLQVNIPSSVTGIPARAFQKCNQVVRVAIPESVTAIGDTAFLGCSSLQSITIPESVTAIGKGAFAGCSSLESITIPESVTAIGDGAFLECSSLESITIPESVTAIGKRAFLDCFSLKSITIPGSVTAIGTLPFKHAVLCKASPSLSL